jgi:hypothetical protein
MSTSPKLRVTKSLLDGWLWSFKRDDGYEDFLRTLNREPLQPTKFMLDGTRYENVLNNVLNGTEIPADHEWYPVITEMAEELQGAQQQVNLYADSGIVYNGVPILLHGVLDYLVAGHIYDCKFTKNYHLNKYFWEDTTQTGMYLALVPEAMDMTYIISDGKYVYRERYPRDIVPEVQITINQFLRWLEKMKLIETFERKWLLT